MRLLDQSLAHSVMQRANSPAATAISGPNSPSPGASTNDRVMDIDAAREYEANTERNLPIDWLAIDGGSFNAWAAKISIQQASAISNVRPE